MTKCARRNIPGFLRAPDPVLGKRLCLGFPLLLYVPARDRFRPQGKELSPEFADAVQWISDFVILHHWRTRLPDDAARRQMIRIRQIGQTDAAESYGILPVWRRLSLLFIFLSAICGGMIVAGEALPAVLNVELNRALSLSLTSLPVALWLLIAVLPEYRVERPRRRLIGVAVVSGLAASAVGLPLAEAFFVLDQWLPLQSVFQRIIGFTLTAGMIDAGLRFTVLRYLIYPQALRVRGDAVAYALASAIGYSFYLSLVLVWRLEPTWNNAAIYVLSSFTIQVVSSLFIALGIIESYFSDAFPLVLPANLLAAALVNGVLQALLPGLLSGPLSQAGAADRPLFGLVFVVAAALVSVTAAYFLYSNSERLEREAYVGHEGIDGI